MPLKEILYWTFSAFVVIWPAILICLFYVKKNGWIIKIVIICTAFIAFQIILGVCGITYFNTWWGAYLLHACAFISLLLCARSGIKGVIYLWIWHLAFENFLAQMPGFFTVLTNSFGSFEMRLFWKIITLVFFSVPAIFIIRHISNKGLTDITWWEIIQGIIIVAVVNIFNRQVFINNEQNLEGTRGEMTFMLQMFAALCAILILYIQREIHFRKMMQVDRKIRERIWALEKKQFEERKEQIDNINRKCHDLKHLISALEFISDKEEYQKNIREIKKAVELYDSSMHTGNLALDTILRDKQMQFENEGVILKCVADRVPSEFMDVVDLYILLGNILDNALESVKNISAQYGRLVEIKIYCDKNFVRIVCSNRFDGKLVFKDGLPLSTKENDGNHGFGLKSVRHTVEKYNGAITIDTEEDYYIIKLLIPCVPDEA